MLSILEKKQLEENALQSEYDEKHGRKPMPFFRDPTYLIVVINNDLVEAIDNISSCNIFENDYHYYGHFCQTDVKSRNHEWYRDLNFARVKKEFLECYLNGKNPKIEVAMGKCKSGSLKCIIKMTHFPSDCPINSFIKVTGKVEFVNS
jgi:hypothetical protein